MKNKGLLFIILAILLLMCKGDDPVVATFKRYYKLFYEMEEVREASELDYMIKRHVKELKDIICIIDNDQYILFNKRYDNDIEEKKDIVLKNIFYKMVKNRESNVISINFKRVMKRRNYNHNMVDIEYEVELIYPDDFFKRTILKNKLVNINGKWYIAYKI